MSTEPRTATVNLLVTKPLEIDEPEWCIGHDDDRAQFKPDVLHRGPDVTLTFNGQVIGAASVVQSPFAETVGTEPGISLSLPGQTLGPAGVRAFADALTEHAQQLRVLADQLAALLGEGR